MDEQIVVREITPMLPIVQARARVVETRESFEGVMILRGRVNGEQTQQSGVQIQMHLDPDSGETPQGITEQLQWTLGPRRGNRFRRDRRYEILVRDVTDEEREEF